MRQPHQMPVRRRLAAVTTALAVPFLLFAPAAAAVPAVVTAIDSSEVTLGDPVHLTLVVRYRTDQHPEWPSAPALKADVAIVEQAPLGPRSTNGLQEMVIGYELRFFELGEHEIPALVVKLITDAGDTTSMSSTPMTVKVASVRGEEDEELRDIKPPVAIPGGVPLWLAAVVAVVALALVVALLRWALSRRRRTGETEARPRTPTDYLVEFKKIAQMGLVERQAFLIYYTLLSQTLRRFLEERVGVDAMERTTEEVADALRHSPVDPDQAQRMHDFLAQADLVKFACAQPAVEQARRAPETGQEIVRTVETSLAASRAEAEAQAELDQPAASTVEDGPTISHEPASIEGSK